MADHGVVARLLGFPDVAAAGTLAQDSGFPSYAQKHLEAAWHRPHTLFPALFTGYGPSRRVVGFMVLEGVPPEMELHLVVVAPDVRGQGWGSRLMAYGEAQIALRGFDRLFLEVAAQTNPRARALYRARSYREIGVRKGYYANGDDAVLYERRCGSSGDRSTDLVVLMGGEGKRMGGALKAALRNADGTSFLVQMLRAHATPRMVGVAPKSMHPRLMPLVQEVSPSWSEAMHWVADEGHGPGPAIVQAARWSTADWLLVMAVDHPRPSTALTARLLRVAEGADGAWVRNREGYPEALVSVVRRSALLAHWHREAPPRSARRLLAPLLMAELDEAELTADEQQALRDVDTAEDAAEWGVKVGGSGELLPKGSST